MKKLSLTFLVLALLLVACAGNNTQSGKPAPNIGVPLSIHSPASSLSGAAAPKVSANTVPALCANTNNTNWATFAAEVIERTNIERAKVQAAAVTKDDKLMNAAETHSIDMACKLFMDHTGSDGSSPFDRMTRFGYAYSTAAENVAAGQTTPQEVVTAWMNSEGHRTNMLNPAYTQIGIGYVFNSDDTNQNNYFHYWTMKLGKPQ